MINQDFVNRLVSLVKQGLIALDDIKVQEYKDAVQAIISTQ